MDPLVAKLVAASAGIIVVTIVAGPWSRRRQAAVDARRREEWRRQVGEFQLQQQEIERLAARILATSSTPSIAGFTIRRQIEALFTDGHPSPARAIEMLKALAARKGANAIINLSSERLPSGKCLARGDAVVVVAAGFESHPRAGLSSPAPSGPDVPGPSPELPP